MNIFNNFIFVIKKKKDNGLPQAGDIVTLSGIPFKSKFVFRCTTGENDLENADDVQEYMQKLFTSVLEVNKK